MKNIIIPLGIFGVIVLLIAGGCFILGQEKTQNFQNEKSQSTSADVVTSAVKKEFSINVSGIDLNLTSKPQFEIGEQFEYEDISSLQGAVTISKITTNVEKIEKLNGREHFVLFTTDDTVVIDSKTGEMIRNDNTIKHMVYNYIDKESGKITKTVIMIGDKEITLDEEASSSYEGWIYSPWMLALKKDLKWESHINMSVEGTMLSGSKNYRVLDIEKVNDRECFKVELVSTVDSPNTNMREINFRSIVWVDVEKRILVKKIKYIENLKINEINLISRKMMTK